VGVVILPTGFIPFPTFSAVRYDDAYITWIDDGKMAWTLYAGGVAADPRVEISARPVPQEPMVNACLVCYASTDWLDVPRQYIIANLGFSLNFGGIDLDRIAFPATMSIDYIRVYQPKDAINIGCDPKDFPTAAYIQTSVSLSCTPDLLNSVLDAGTRRLILIRT
jgi:hypothetical protein